MRSDEVDGLDAMLRARIELLKERSHGFHEWVRVMTEDELSAAAGQIRREVAALADDGDEIRAMYDDSSVSELKLTG